MAPGIGPRVLVEAVRFFSHTMVSAHTKSRR